MAIETNRNSAELGSSVPVCTPHAVSVSLPLWKDNVDYELGLQRVHDKLSTGYPRFFIHHDIRKLAEVCRAAHALTAQEQCMLFPSEKAAIQCRQFIAQQALKQPTPKEGLEKRCRMVRFETCSTKPTTSKDHHSEFKLQIFLLFVPNDEVFSIARTFWQHTGLGISSRFAERILRLLGSCSVREAVRKSPSLNLQHLPSPPHPPSVAPRRYNIKQSPQFSFPATLIPTDAETDENTSTYVEERYGRNLPIEHVCGAKLALRRRIADILAETTSDGTVSPPVQNLKESHRGSGKLTESDIYLYPSGMSAIFSSHQLAMSLQKRLRPNSPIGKSICFGFPYTDTLKIIEKWGPGAHFFGHGEAADLEALENMLHDNQTKSNPPIAALFCEFPSNPLLKSPDLARLRALADRFGFLIIIDETIGNFLNVEVLPYSDILVSSLTKVFSGDSNVMGGSMIVNPSSAHHRAIRDLLDGDLINPTGIYEDIYFGEDAIYMERNSRDFRARVAKINHNADGICEYLMSLIQSGDNKIIKSLHYPRYTTPENYERCRRKQPAGGYGGLFSIIFNDPTSCERFYDNLKTYKGPSLGTNFTLCSPYVILAHFHELDWAKQYGVDSNLIRVSVGLEDLNCLLDWFKFAFESANS